MNNNLMWLNLNSWQHLGLFFAYFSARGLANFTIFHVSYLGMTLSLVPLVIVLSRFHLTNKYAMLEV